MTRLFLATLMVLAIGGTTRAETKHPLIIVSARTGNPEIFLIDPDTGDAKNLTNHPAKDTMPAWSPDGKLIAFSSDRDGSNNLFIMGSDGSNLRQLTHEKAGINCTGATWSPDCKRIAYERVGDRPELWVVHADGKEAVKLVEPGANPAWSPDGRQIAFTAEHGGQGFCLCVVDANGSSRRELVSRATSVPFPSPAWSPDGRWIAYSDLADRALELFLIDPASNRRRQLTSAGFLNFHAAWMPEDGGSLTFVHVEPNASFYMQIDLEGTRLGISQLSGPLLRESPVPAGRPAWRLSARPGRTELSLLDPETGANARLVPLGRMSGQRGPLNQAVFAPDGKTLATCSEDGIVGVSEIHGQALQPLHLLAGHAGPVWSCSWAPDGKILATGGRDRTVRLWDVAHRVPFRTLDDHQAPVTSVAYSPDGKTLATGDLDRSVEVREAEGGKPRFKLALPGHQGQGLAALAFSPDGRTLVAGGGSWDEPKRGTLSAWDPSTGKSRWSVTEDLPAVWGLAYAPDGKTLALAGLDGTLRLRDPATGKERAVFRGHVDRAFSVAFTPDGKSLASCGYDNTIRLWDVATGRQTTQRAGHLISVQRIGISPDGKLLASAGGDGLVLLWRLGD